MREEIKNPGTELNEAALKNASAGESNTPQLNEAELAGVSGGKEWAETYADMLCHKCYRFANNCGPHSFSSRWSELVRYIKEHGNPRNPSNCPFYYD